MNSHEISSSSKIGKLLMSEDDLRKAAISDFASMYLSEVQKLVDKHGKSGFMDLLNSDSTNSE